MPPLPDLVELFGCAPDFAVELPAPAVAFFDFSDEPVEELAALAPSVELGAVPFDPPHPIAPTIAAMPRTSVAPTAVMRAVALPVAFIDFPTTPFPITRRVNHKTNRSMLETTNSPMPTTAFT